MQCWGELGDYSHWVLSLWVATVMNHSIHCLFNCVMLKVINNYVYIFQLMNRRMVQAQSMHCFSNSSSVLPVASLCITPSTVLYAARLSSAVTWKIGQVISKHKKNSIFMLSRRVIASISWRVLLCSFFNKLRVWHWIYKTFGLCFRHLDWSLVFVPNYVCSPIITMKRCFLFWHHFLPAESSLDVQEHLCLLIAHFTSEWSAPWL